MEKSIGWMLTDEDSFQLRRKLSSGAYELYQITQMGEDKAYNVSHGIIYPEAVDMTSVLDCFGYDSLEELQNVYGNAWESIVAECEFELNAFNSMILSNGPSMTWMEARELIHELTGYRTEKFFRYMRLHQSCTVGDYQFISNGDCLVEVTEPSGKTHLIQFMEDAVNLMNNGLAFRICDACGAPMTAGWTNEAGFGYFCSEDEFEKNMDMRYGPENWRPEDSYYTEWQLDSRLPEERQKKKIAIPFMRIA